MNSEKNKSSNRSFGIVFFIIFFLISLYPTLNNENINLYFLSISIVFLILGLLNSKLLNPLNKLWFKFGILLGNLISPIIMGLVYFFVITPIAMLLKIFNKDVLNLKQNKKNTYWIDKIKSESTMKDQF